MPEEVRRADHRRHEVQSYQYVEGLSQTLPTNSFTQKNHEELLDLFLNQAENDSDASQLVRHAKTIFNLFFFANHDKKLKLADRIFVDLDLAKEDDLKIAESLRKRINQELSLPARDTLGQAHRDVVINHLGPAEHGEYAVTGGELYARALLVGVQGGQHGRAFRNRSCRHLAQRGWQRVP